MFHKSSWENHVVFEPYQGSSGTPCQTFLDIDYFIQQFIRESCSVWICSRICRRCFMFKWALNRIESLWMFNESFKKRWSVSSLDLRFSLVGGLQNVQFPWICYTKVYHHMCESCSLNLVELQNSLPFQVVLFMNSILLLNNINQLVVIAYGARTCGFVFNSESSSSEPSGSRNKRQQVSFPSRILKQLERFLQKESVLPEEVNFNEFSLLSGALSMSLCCILTFTTPKYRYEIFKIWIWLCIPYIKAWLHPRLEDFFDIMQIYKEHLKLVLHTPNLG